LKTNLEAAAEIAKQLRLRDIGGIIIIDFIDMHLIENQKQVMEALRDSLKKDRTKTIVVGMTGLGLIEMTRKKVRQGLDSVIHINCMSCDGTGKILSPETIARNIEKEISLYFNKTIAQAIQVEVHSEIAKVLMGADGENLSRIEKMYNKKIVIKESKDVKYEEMKIKEIDINLVL
jgi:ribonuclease G